MAKGFPPLGKLYKICGVNALDIDVALLFPAYTQRGSDRDIFIDVCVIDVCGYISQKLFE
ncbi:hypothetical protein FEV09_05680 [Pseudanabaena catenata USMAC16]|uniref:Uncharacterized protein n=1 Tax=Pseudanabaena catenata USMAC16 TaxID=1855837 RepID=A0A9X4M711_9CYAN|nr:hypothetical protein [Pseudanabaena catenata]MDG3494044.1 hypothetical protein [Pseudanabaena catenata USMAC16]